MVEQKTKPIIRVARARTYPKRKLPPGTYHEGILDDEYAALVGQIITILPHIEELMIGFMSRLLGHPGIDHGPARQIFRAIESERARISVLTSLLENAYVNAEKPPIFDEVISLFATVKNRRNDIAHGLWFTHEKGWVYMTLLSSDTKSSILAKRRKVPIQELKEDIKRIEKLAAKIHEATNWIDPNPIPVGAMRFRITTKPKPVASKPES